MQVNLFDFHLPQDLIATKPASPRDHARLLHVTGDEFQDKHIYDLPDMLRAGDVLVVNNTRVIPAALTGKRGDTKIHFNLHQSLDNNTWLAFAKPARKLKAGDRVTFANNFLGTIMEKRDGGEVLLHFETDDLMASLHTHGKMPLPPYIKRDDDNTADKQDYQTHFARHLGAVAAPTAGLHFTPELLNKLQQKGIEVVEITLHVGAGTFLPVKVDNTQDHKMHHEWCDISEKTLMKLNQAKQENRRIIACGTTVLRTLESRPNLYAGTENTDVFITPGFSFNHVDALLTNFHLPKSTLFMLVAAFQGLERMQAAYKHAISKKYRFYSYGDACLLGGNSKI